MAIVRAIAEGIGPFDRLDLDLSDGKGNPHLGPHILAGVNGSGKTTALRAIAWALDQGICGFPYDEWAHALSGHEESRSLVLLQPIHDRSWVHAATNNAWPLWAAQTVGWIKTELSEVPPWDINPPGSATVERLYCKWLSFSGNDQLDVDGFIDFAAYAPSQTLRFLDRPDLTKVPKDSKRDCLSFQATVNNEAVHAWLLSIYSKRAIAKERRQATENYARSISLFEKALKLIYGPDVFFDVEIEPQLQPRIRRGSQTLNFSQLPDGIRTGVAWIADFLMRGDLTEWDPTLKGRRPGILLLDEIDTHLHPRWQRTLLPAMREALPDVQIIVTSHSPFVISSCPGARIHVLEVDDKGKAYARPPEDAPVGQSVTATLKDIFGVPSEFDVETERQLDEWNDLVKLEAAGKLSSKEKTQLRKLAKTLSSKGEELRFMVESPPKLSQSLAKSLTASLGNPGNGGRSGKTSRRKKAVVK